MSAAQRIAATLVGALFLAGIKLASAHPVLGIAIRPNGAIVFTDGDLSKREPQLWELSADRKTRVLRIRFPTSWPSYGPFHPHGLALDENGDD